MVDNLNLTNKKEYNMSIIDKHTVNVLQRELQKADAVFNKATKEVTTGKTCDRLHRSNASEAKEASIKYSKVAKLNEKLLAEVQATIARMENSLGDATALEQAAADPESALPTLNRDIATLIADIVSYTPELNSATTLDLNTYDGALGSIISTSGSAVTVGSDALQTIAEVYDAGHTVPGTISSSADITVPNLTDNGITKEVHTDALNKLISNIKDALGVAHAAEKKLQRHIGLNEINKDLKAELAEIDHSVDVTDLKRDLSDSSVIIANIRSLLY
jgi:hypothetical protein